jgi:hypothetical protein
MSAMEIMWNREFASNRENIGEKNLSDAEKENRLDKARKKKRTMAK